MYRIFFCLLPAILLSSSAPSQPVRVEPMNWWTGMKDNKVQLLLHGPGMGQYKLQVNYPGVKLLATHRAESPNYLFADLQISAQARPGNVPITFWQNGRKVFTHLYPVAARDRELPNRPGFSAEDVIYLITPDRFANGDPGNDVVPGMRETKSDRSQPYGRHGGDIRGMIKYLDYIRDMGFTAVWPTPLLENDMAESSYHGYAITDHYKVDPRFGTLDDYRELAAGCRQRGLKLIFDGVINHIGTAYWWMKDLPFSNWLNYPDSIRITNHRRTVHQDPYAAPSEQELMVKGWFVSSMPDLNHENPFLATYLIQNNLWWIETLGLQGLRQDTYPYSPKKFLQQWTCRIRQEYPRFRIVGEEWSTNPLIAAYWQEGKVNSSGYNGCLGSTMDFPLQLKLVEALTEPEAWDKGLVKLYEALANDFVYARPDELLIFGDNHDMDRLFTFLKNDPALTRMAMAYLLTIRGIPQVYYGTEVLLNNSGHPGHHGIIRTDFPGGWKGDTVNAFTGEGLTAEQRRMQDELRRLLNWRKGNKVISAGRTMHFAPQDGTYTYFRYSSQGTVMVVLNKNEQEVLLNAARFSEMTAGKKSARSVLDGTTQSLSGPIRVPARSALILELQ